MRRDGGSLNEMNAHWIHIMPGGLVTTAILAWLVSRQGSESLFERIRFCLASMLVVAALVWEFQLHPTGFHEDTGCLTVDGIVMAIMATAFLALLWIGKVRGMLTGLLFGCVDSSDDRQWDSTGDARQIETAARLFRNGNHRRALRLCNWIIASNSQYASTAATLVYWIENPGTLRFFNPPRTTIKLKERCSV
jgi:hypothetical protein